jgi:KUP system potassium uptake protein
VILLGLFGAALFYGDGLITPAISVLSAVEGLEVATPLFALHRADHAGHPGRLFWIQSHGTAKVGVAFGPITCVWFGALAAWA